MLYNVIAERATNIKTNALVVFYCQAQTGLPASIAQIDQKLSGTIKRLIDVGEIKGKVGEVTIIHSGAMITPQRVVVCGLGKKDALKPDVLRQAAGSACKALTKKGVKEISFLFLIQN